MNSGQAGTQESQREAYLEVDTAGAFPISRIATIGRAPECDVAINTLSVSRQHARIFLEGGRFWIKDLESSNGTYVNGVKAALQMLSDGDVVCFGEVRSVFHTSAENVQRSAVLPDDPLADLKSSFSDGTPTGSMIGPNIQPAAQTQLVVNQDPAPMMPAAGEDGLLRRIQELEAEKERLKKLVAQLERVLADSNLRIRNLQERLEKK
jgi:pSer/pThr/pTyr-binding forkhead associated (FHA) protein